MKMLLPPYVVHMLSIFFYLYVSEKRRDLMINEMLESIFTHTPAEETLAA